MSSNAKKSSLFEENNDNQTLYDNMPELIPLDAAQEYNDYSYNTEQQEHLRCQEGPSAFQ